MKMSNSYRVEVIARHLMDGSALPLEIIWMDGRHFTVDKVRHFCKASSLKSGGVGIKYSCRICGKEVVLYDREGKWFLEN